MNIEPDWRPSASLEVLRHRARMLAAARACFAEAGVLEVETPLLSHAAVTDFHLESVPAEVAGQGRMYLHTSPEYPMKRLLAAGVGDCYQVCRVFRDGERGSNHNPEFTMIEWYRLDFDAGRLMDDVESLVRRMLSGLRQLPAAERVTYREVVQELGGADPMTASADELAAALRRHGISTVLAGHVHANNITTDADVTVVANGPVGMPLRDAVSGFRIFRIGSAGLDHRYFALEDVAGQEIYVRGG